MKKMRTICDPAVVAVPIEECHDPLVDLRKEGRILFGPPPERPDNVCYTKMRQIVYEKLCEAEKLLPQGIRFCLYEGWRSLELQGELFNTMYENNRNHYPEMNPKEVFLETTKLVSPVTLLDGTRNVPPHSTGAAIDLYLVDRAGNRLDMGIATDEWTLDTGARLSITDSPHISDEARRNRAIMSRALVQVGFINYPFEYWHWSYGDRYWAFSVGSSHALFGPIMSIASDTASTNFPLS